MLSAVDMGGGPLERAEWSLEKSCAMHACIIRGGEEMLEFRLSHRYFAIWSLASLDMPWVE